MNKLLTTTAVAMLLSVGPALAAEDAQPKAAEEAIQNGQPAVTENGQPPTTENVTPDTAAEAKIPDEGEPDESGGATERSSAPPESGAVSDDSAAAEAEGDELGGKSSATGQLETEDSDSSME